MQTTNLILPTLIQYLIQLPVYLVWLVGIGLAVRYRRAHPRASTSALIGFAIFFVRSLVETALNMWLPLVLHRGGWAAQDLGLAMAGRNIISVLIAAVAWGLIVAAIFSGRQHGGSSRT